jgi:hypothetical protein
MKMTQTNNIVKGNVLVKVNIFARQLTNSRVGTGPGKPGKSWNFNIPKSRPGNPGKSILVREN